MRLRRLGLMLAAALALAPAAARADLLIQVDKSTQRMTVNIDGDPVYTWPVSTGRRGYGTPSGSFHALGMDRNHFSREWDDAPMPHSIFFTNQGHAIHGTYEQRNLGRAVSHGCVRLSLKNAATLWDLVKEQGKANTTVVLTGEAPARNAPLLAQGGQDDAANADDEDVTGELPPPRRYYYRERPRYYYRARPYYPVRRTYRYGGYPFGYPFGR